MSDVSRAVPQRVLVTGVGGAPGFDLARSLMRLGREVIAADADALASGLRLEGVTARTMAPAGHPDYVSGLLALCREVRPDALLSTVEQELPQLIAQRAALEELGVATWLPEAGAVQACVDKAEFHRVLTRWGIPTPRTFSPDELDAVPDGMALVVKPRCGQGAQNVHFCFTGEQAQVLCELVPKPIVQERVEGREFTADCLVDRDGRASVVLRDRLLVKGGLAVVSRTFRDRAVAEQVERTLAAVGAVGACCVQGFVSEDGAIAMTEINARVGGGFPLAEAAGADLVGQTLNGLAGLPVDHDRLWYEPGVHLTKYTETLAVW
ncbi:ATP-grasp domain-containing protein [Streptomyces sp. WMMC940]|uniref:ATP-grasp domain-containing protein n=1 Tax=Streptomyces sp. WMMC940 TaxID=3015153 RepID=UPI0022B661CB|nr:ATP-grasp domain-containing protein [Streptomyces sp. WMMC940]MCZ7458239.1 ATP-grasp domain-containing protein [Streptomyces sp. WMMC940]